MTVQFAGESNWDVIVNHNSLDIVEEEEFGKFVIAHGHNKESELHILEAIYLEWVEKREE